LDLVKAIVNGNSNDVADYLVELIRLILKLAARNAGALVGDGIFEAYLQIGRCTDDSLESIRVALGVATLRSMNSEPIPERWQQEALIGMCFVKIQSCHIPIYSRDTPNTNF
jgi:hypothetical protein